MVTYCAISRCKVWIDETHQRQVAGKFRIAQEAVHARAQREDRFQAAAGFSGSRAAGGSRRNSRSAAARSDRVPCRTAVEGGMAEQRLAQRVPARRQQEQDVRLADSLSRSASWPSARLRRAAAAGAAWQARHRQPARRAAAGAAAAGAAAASARAPGWRPGASALVRR